jgi:hypothetical protein
MTEALRSELSALGVGVEARECCRIRQTLPPPCRGTNEEVRRVFSASRVPGAAMSPPESSCAPGKHVVRRGSVLVASFRVERVLCRPLMVLDWARGGGSGPLISCRLIVPPMAF